MNDANRNESEIKCDCCEFGLSTLATNASVLLGEQVSFGPIFDAGQSCFPAEEENFPSLLPMTVCKCVDSFPGWKT